MKPETTVIIPTYERAPQLRRALDALASSETQREAFEVIVVDDGGSGDLAGVAREFDARLNLTLLRQENSGPAAARNLGASRARGSLLAFTDDDCRPAPGWIGALREAHQRHPEALVGGRTVNALPDNRWALTSQLIVEMARQFYSDSEHGPRFFASNNMAIPADGYRELGGFSEAFRKAAEDRELCDRWYQAGRPALYEPTAVVAHSHDLTAGSFWRQHYRYGFGAWGFHEECRRRGSGRLSDHTSFHLEIVSLLRRATPGATAWERLRLIPRLLVWQIANGVGFFGGMLSGGRARPS